MKPPPGGTTAYRWQQQEHMAESLITETYRRGLSDKTIFYDIITVNVSDFWNDRDAVKPRQPSSSLLLFIRLLRLKYVDTLTSVLICDCCYPRSLT